jgi:hypothetical protein
MKTKLVHVGVVLCLVSSALLPVMQARDQQNREITRREIAVTFDDLPGVQTPAGSVIQKHWRI